MRIINFLNHMQNKWGLNKTITVIGLNLSAMGIVTCIAVNVIPNNPDEPIKEKEIFDHE